MITWKKLAEKINCELNGEQQLQYVKIVESVQVPEDDSEDEENHVVSVPDALCWHPEDQLNVVLNAPPMKKVWWNGNEDVREMQHWQARLKEDRFCDHCADLLPKGEPAVCVPTLEVEVASARIGESATLCRGCANFIQHVPRKK